MCPSLVVQNQYLKADLKYVATDFIKTLKPLGYFNMLIKISKQ